MVDTDASGNTTYTRYKYNANTQTWAAEYVLNNSSFTAAQWATIQSGITEEDVRKVRDLPFASSLPVGGQLTAAGFQFLNSSTIVLFTIPFANSTRGGLITLEYLTRFLDLGTKQELDARFNAKQDKLIDGEGVEIKDNIISVNLNKETSVDYSVKYFTTRALEDDCEIRLEIGSAVPTSVLTSISYSINNGRTWTTVNNVDNEAVIVTPPVINKDKVIFWKGTGIGVSTTVDDNDRYSTSSVFYSTKKYEVEGNIMSLIYGDNFATQTTVDEAGYNFAMLFYAKDKTNNLYNAKNLILPIKIVPQYCYLRMFQNSAQLKYAPRKIDAEEIGYYSCMSMFYSCSELIEAPEELPAMTIGEGGYRALFSYCGKLEKAPELPATTIAKQAYYQFCQYCHNLKYGPSVLPALEVGYETYRSMFWECYELEKAPEILATSVGFAGMKQMFRKCNSLTHAPELPATTIGEQCYEYMFECCANLTHTCSVLPATTLAKECYRQMFDYCPSLTTIPMSDLEDSNFLPATTLAEGCYMAMFQECPGLTMTPQLPATILADNCYKNMFYSCGITAGPAVLPATGLAKKCYEYMFGLCTMLLFPPILPADTVATAATDCYKGMFGGCHNLRELRIYLDGDATQLAPANINGIVGAANETLAFHFGKLYIYSTTLAEDDNFLKQFNGWDLYLNDVFVKKINVV